MDQICKPTECTGCSACYNACGCCAISMIENNEGFLKPQINQDKCVDCGRCVKVCPANNDLPLYLPTESFACHAKDVEEQLTSSSGGVASMISRVFIENDGVVYGCMMSTGYKAYHTRVDKLKDIDQLKGSKYVQSNIGTIYRDVRKDLMNDKRVLFIGTPCQVSGLKFYLSKEYDNLYTLDFVCHGVPSQRILDGAISSLSKSHNLDGTRLQFRFKEQHKKSVDHIFCKGADAKSREYKSIFSLHFVDGQGTVRYSERYPFSKYITGYLTALFYRESCYVCRYAVPKRISDLTCGDFMESEIEKLLPGGHRKISMLCVNTIKGKYLFESVKNSLEVISVDYSKVVECHNQLHHPMPRNPKRQVFMDSFVSYGFEEAMNVSFKKELENNIRHYYKQLIKYYLMKIPGFSKIYKCWNK